jgi:two-component system cell cycle sensor histidine kinase/response regulator CckA
MTDAVRVLLVEDIPTDAELVKREIRRVLPSCSFQCTDNRDEFIEALADFQPDLIVSDYRLPRFDGLAALTLALEKMPLTPVIIITGAINEDTAVECMKAGAADYVIKEHLKRLGQAVLHALEERQLRLERRRDEERLEYQANLLQNVSDAIIAVDLKLDITSWNRAAEELYGWRAAEVLGKRIDGMIQLPISIEAVVPWIREHGAWKGELKQKHRDGRPIEVFASISTIRDSQGQPVGIVAIVHDITEQKRAEEERAKLEEQLQQSRKMEGLGRLAGGIAHDFNNLLSVIQGYCEIMQETMPAENPLQRELKEIHRAGDKAATLTRQLLAFSRRQILAPTKIDLNDLVSELQEMLARLIGEDIRVTTALASGLKQIKADRSQIEQVVLNLVINAREAMPDGGTLVIRTGNVHLDEAHTCSHPESPEGPCVLLEVADTGGGMDETTRFRLFEPFFTTKNAKGGTGLGLATVYGIVKQSGGDILVHSVPGRGSSFKIYFPASEEPAAEKPASTAPRSEGGHGETVLLVEDEQPLRILVRQMLESNGYTVIEASDGSDALRRVNANDGPIDLLLTDMVMPRIGGGELAERLRSMRPGIPVLFMSGYAEEMTVRNGLGQNRVEYLTKPFTSAALKRKIRELLNG